MPTSRLGERRDRERPGAVRELGGILTADVSFDLEHAGGVIVLFTYILPDALQATAAVALSCFGLVARHGVCE